MIGTAFAPEPMPDAEALRKLIREHRGSHSEVLFYRCALFYQEALVELHTHSVERANVVRTCMEALLSAPTCMVEHRMVSSNPDSSKALGNLAAYAFIQVLTQIVEAMAGLEKPLNLDFEKLFGHKTGNRDRGYWKFRNRHSHVVGTRNSVRSPGDPEGSDHHIFRLGRTSADWIYFTTLADTGFMDRSASTDKIAWELQSDLGISFDAALAAIRARPER